MTVHGTSFHVVRLEGNSEGDIVLWGYGVIAYTLDPLGRARFTMLPGVYSHRDGAVAAAHGETNRAAVS